MNPRAEIERLMRTVIRLIEQKPEKAAKILTEWVRSVHEKKSA